MKIQEKLLEVQKKVLKFGKDGNNPFYKSKYLTLENLLDKLLPICNELEILIYHTTKENNVDTYVYYGGEYIISSFPISNISDPQKIGSIISYGKRYNLGQIFNIVTDDDDDGNKASEKSKQKFVFGVEQLEKFKKDWNKHKEKLTTYEKAIEMIKNANYTIDDEVSNLLKVFYDDINK